MHVSEINLKQKIKTEKRRNTLRRTITVIAVSCFTALGPFVEVISRYLIKRGSLFASNLWPSLASATNVAASSKSWKTQHNSRCIGVMT